MAMPRDNDSVYWVWLLYGESFEKTAQFFGVTRGNVWKRVRKIDQRIMAGCECDSWRCHCGR